MEIVNTCPSPVEPPTRRSVRHSSTPQVKMLCVQGVFGKTPGRGSVMENCWVFGICWALRQFWRHLFIHEVWSFEKEHIVACSVCKRKTAQFLWKYRRHLSNEDSLKGIGRYGTKYSKNFSAKVSVLTGNDSLQRDREGKPVFKMEYGVLSYCIMYCPPR